MHERLKPDLISRSRENVISGRRLSEYEESLGFRKEELAGRKVLDFGCGGANIKKELADAHIDCTVVAVDILPNPHAIHDPTLTTGEQELRRKIMERKIKDDQEGQPNLPPIEEYENSLLGIEGRDFVKLSDAAELPFTNDHFDEALVLWSFHQLPPGEHETCLKELLRVATRIRIAPVGRYELTEIKDTIAKYPNVQIQIIPLSASDQEVMGSDYIGELDIDRSVRPHSVNAANTVRVVLERE